MSVLSLSFSDSFVIVAYPFFNVNGFFAVFYKFFIFFCTHTYTHKQYIAIWSDVVFALYHPAAEALLSDV